MSEADRLRGTGIMWEGIPQQVHRLQDMLADFDVDVAQAGMRLLIIPYGKGDPVVINLGDEVVQEGEQFGVLRTSEDWHKDAGTA
jgi:hypothetical protein